MPIYAPIPVVHAPVYGVDDGGSLHFTVFQKPLVMPRPRCMFGVRIGKGYLYNPAKPRIQEWRLRIRDSLSLGQLSPVLFPEHLCLQLEVSFRVKRPPSHYNSTGHVRIGAPLRVHGDTDNFAKFIQDVMNLVVYHDDGQVVTLVCTKSFAEQESTSIRITPVTHYPEH
jgi:Holliday junction resolvase RusA-like endonuclease